ncbi:MAG: cobalt ECF transporter T component CbiQ [Clostridia bacterium]
MIKALNNIRLLDDLARGETYLHRIHPLVKLLTTFVFLVSIISFDRFEIINLLPFLVYPMYIVFFAELPIRPILKRMLMVAPFVLSIGILNPIFDRNGWLTFFSIVLKSLLTVSAGILLIATTGMERLSGALRILKVPKTFVLQLLLTYRYISVLIEEVGRMQRAYALRAPGQKGIQRSAWGSFAGQLVLRTFERAQRIYESMYLRGFEGEYHTGKTAQIMLQDVLYLICWSAYFLILRAYNVPYLIGNLLMGVIK